MCSLLLLFVFALTQKEPEAGPTKKSRIINRSADAVAPLKHWFASPVQFGSPMLMLHGILTILQYIFCFVLIWLNLSKKGLS